MRLAPDVTGARVGMPTNVTWFPDTSPWNTLGCCVPVPAAGLPETLEPVKSRIPCRFGTAKGALGLNLSVMLPVLGIAPDGEFVSPGRGEQLRMISPKSVEEPSLRSIGETATLAKQLNTLPGVPDPPVVPPATLAEPPGVPPLIELGVDDGPKFKPIHCCWLFWVN